MNIITIEGLKFKWKGQRETLLNIVHISLMQAEGLIPLSRFEAVSKEGIITTINKSTTLYLVDGSDEISSGYSILDAKISRYEH